MTLIKYSFILHSLEKEKHNNHYFLNAQEEKSIRLIFNIFTKFTNSPKINYIGFYK